MRFASIVLLAGLFSFVTLLGEAVLAGPPVGSGGGTHTPLPTPTPKPTPKPIPAPTNVRETRDPQVCGSHAGPVGAFACPPAFTSGFLVLVFNWSGNKAYPAVNGFNVYQVDNGLHKLVAQNTTQATVGIVKGPLGGFGHCYTVTAVVGKRESKDSRPWRCLSANSVGPFTTEVVANEWTQRSRSQGTLTGYTPKCSTAAPCVGWTDDYYYDESSHKALQFSAYYRAYFHFRLGPDLKHRYLIKATLSTPTASHIGTNCLYELGPAASNWMSESRATDLVGGDFHPTNGASLSAGIDVISIVRSWTDGSVPNDGFVLRGKSETLKLPSTLTERPPSLVPIGCVEALDKRAKLSIVHS
jgi:hypothetical protein